MLAWWMLLPTLLAMMVALVLPGFMWLRAGDVLVARRDQCGPPRSPLV